MTNPRQLIKICALVLALIGIFIIKDFLAKPNLTSFFDSLSIQPKVNPAKTSLPKASVAASSSLVINELSTEQFDLWLAQIQSSTAAVDQIAKVIYKKDDEKNIATLKLLLETDPHNALLNYLLIQACLSQVGIAQCSNGAILSLQSFASDNGVVRDLEFLSSYRKGDLAHALSTLNEANHSPYTNDFTYAKFSILAQSMENFGIKRDLHMFENIEGVLAAGIANHLTDLSSICKENQNQREWRDACYARGQSLAERGKDGYSKLVGLNLMKNFGAESDPAYVKANNQFKARLNAATQNNVLRETMAAKGWAPNDLQWQEFMLRYETQGDGAAKQYLESLMQQN